MTARPTGARHATSSLVISHAYFVGKGSESSGANLEVEGTPFGVQCTHSCRLHPCHPLSSPKSTPR